MKSTPAVILSILLVPAVGAGAQSFDGQALQIMRELSATARQNGQSFSASSARLAAAQAQAAWQKVTGIDGTFTAEMPAAPDYREVTTPGKDGREGTRAHAYVVQLDDRAFIIQTAVYAANVDTSDPKSNLQGGLDHAARNMEGGKWISVTWKTHQGLTAVDAVGRRNGHEMRTFTVMRGQQIFAMIYAGLDGTSRSEDANRFFDSLNIR